MRVDDNYGSTLGCEPNSYGEWQEQPDAAEPPLSLEGAADHWHHRKDDDDYYSQPGTLFRMMNPAQREALFGNTARAMGDAPREIKIRYIGNCLKAEPAYGEGVAKALGLFVPVLPTTPFLLLAADCALRGSRTLHQWLLTNPVFGEYLRRYRNHEGLPLGVTTHLL